MIRSIRIAAARGNGFIRAATLIVLMGAVWTWQIAQSL